MVPGTRPAGWDHRESVASWVGAQLARLALPSAWAALALGALWLGSQRPDAPWALAVADHALAQGRPMEAAIHLEAIARVHPDARARRGARERAALVYATALGAPADARRHWSALLDGAPPEQAAAWHDRVAATWLADGDHAMAAQHGLRAAEASPDAHAAARRSLAAAGSLAASGKVREADALYREVSRRHPAWHAEAELGRALWRLSRGQVERALTRFEAVLDHSYAPEVVAVARLGRSTCLERLGDLDLALAELEEAELPEAVSAPRGGAMRGRRLVR